MIHYKKRMAENIWTLVLGLFFMSYRRIFYL